MIKLIFSLVFIVVLVLVLWMFKILKRKYLEPIFISIMIFGIVALCQPFIFKLYNYGFAILLTGTGGYMFASHMKLE